ncbi:MAG: NTP transferase domain-containing protein, partial [Anaerolineales bacterium]
MIAILLAGGQSSRFAIGSFMPKPLIYIGTKPVINQIVDKLLKTENIETIYVLAGQEQYFSDSDIGQENKFDLDARVALWRSWKYEWYPDKEKKFDKVKLVFGEDLPPNIGRSGKGAILGLYRFLLWIHKGASLEGKRYPRRIEPPGLDDNDHLLICAADNYWEDELDGLL